jgi:hypothetical protein
MDIPPNRGYREASEATRLCFSTNRNRVELILDSEWSSVLRPSIHDRIELGTCGRHPGTLLVFVDPRSQGQHRWQSLGGKGGLRVEFQCKMAFKWCRPLLPDAFEFIPTEIEVVRGYPGIRGVVLNWPGWIEVIGSTLTSDESEGILARQVDSMRFRPEIFPVTFIDGERVLT